MAIEINPRPNSPEIGTTPPTATFHLRATGEQDEAIVQAYATAFVPYLYSHPSGAILYRQDIQVKAVGFKNYEIDVPFGVDKTSYGSFKLSFDTQGGTIHIGVSKQTIAAFGTGSNVSDFQQAIGVDQNGNVEGAEIIIPVLKITATATFNQGVITIPQIKNLARWTGKVNSDVFLTFDPGEVLFLGATGDEGTDQPTTLSCHFACQENLTGLSIGGISSIAKDGHDLYWVAFKEGTSPDNKRKVKVPDRVYVERVYDRIPLAASLGFGG